MLLTKFSHPVVIFEYSPHSLNINPLSGFTDEESYDWCDVFRSSESSRLNLPNNNDDINNATGRDFIKNIFIHGLNSVGDMLLLAM